MDPRPCEDAVRPVRSPDPRPNLGVPPSSASSPSGRFAGSAHAEGGPCRRPPAADRQPPSTSRSADFSVARTRVPSRQGGEMAGAVYFWQQWDIQILVVLSFTLQVILLLFAGIRRREGSALLRTLLWLAYIMADYIAIYALGHMSISSRSSDHPIMPFWAPFLLLHLGGPDTITAYAFQDNQLWLRHLLTLVVQVTGAAYVLVQFIVAGRNSGTLLAAAALMFFSGCLKYGERTWALKCGGLDSIANSQYNYEYKMMSSGSAFHDHGRHRRSPYHGREGGKRLDTEEVLLGAHYLRHFCRGLLADRPVMERLEYEVVRQGIQLNGDMYLYELVGMQLSIMYDILYTKAAVIHTWYGLCIRIISPLSAVAAFFLFQFSSKEKDASSSSRVDIVVTYILLAGALVLEMASSLRAAGSSWACASIHARGWYRLCSAVMRIRQLLKVGSRRACLDTLGQYNLLDICTDAKDDLRGKIAKKIGLEDWWRKLHYSSTIPISDGVKTLVLREVRRMGIQDRRNARGKWILKERGMYEDLRRVADETEVDRSINVWHIATDLYLSMCPDPEDASDGMIRDQIRVLSNYMFFLLVLHPYLLPGVVRSSRYKQNYRYFITLWWVMMGSTKEDTMSSSRATIVKKIGEWQVPADSMDKYISSAGVERHDDMSAYVWLAGMLLGNRWSLSISGMVQVIAGVWVEMLCYAGYHCGEESHARKLSTGAEFINAVWLLLEHAEMHDRSYISDESLAALREL